MRRARVPRVDSLTPSGRDIPSMQTRILATMWLGLLLVGCQGTDSQNSPIAAQSANLVCAGYGMRIGTTTFNNCRSVPPYRWTNRAILKIGCATTRSLSGFMRSRFQRAASIVESTRPCLGPRRDRDRRRDAARERGRRRQARPTSATSRPAAGSFRWRQGRLRARVRLPPME